MHLDDLKEKLAAIEHERWADWQKWCHKILRDELRFNDMGTNLEEILERWDRQIETKYEDLSEQEKQSDREQVERYWPLITNEFQALINGKVQAQQDLLRYQRGFNNPPLILERKHKKTREKRG